MALHVVDGGALFDEDDHDDDMYLCRECTDDPLLLIAQRSQFTVY